MKVNSNVQTSPVAAGGPTSNISALIRRSDARKHDSMTTVSAGCCQRHKQQHGCPVIFALFSLLAFQQSHFQGNVKDFWTTDCQNWVAHTIYIYILAPKPAGFFSKPFFGHPCAWQRHLSLWCRRLHPLMDVEGEVASPESEFGSR